MIGSIMNGINGWIGTALNWSNNQGYMDYLYQQLAQQWQEQANERRWQKQKYQQDMDFANRQLQSQIDIANQNFGLQQEQFQYQKDLNALQMQREDSAFQRQMADLTKAGFSPLAAIGGNGAAAGSLNAGTAPQLDASGIATASGQYLDLARQYASLHAELSSKQVEQRQAAAFAIAQMKQDLHFKNQSLSTEVFNSAVNARNKSLQNASLQEDIQTKKYANKYYEEHGYSQTTLATVLSDFLNSDDVKEAKKRFIEMFGNGLNGFSQSIDGLGKTTEILISGLKDLQKGQAELSKAQNEQILKSLGDNEKSFFQEYCERHNIDPDTATVLDWIKCALSFKADRDSPKIKGK